MAEHHTLRITWRTADGLEVTTTQTVDYRGGVLPMYLDRPVAIPIRLDEKLEPSVRSDSVRRRYELKTWGPWPFTRYATYEEVPPHG